MCSKYSSVTYENSDYFHIGHILPKVLKASSEQESCYVSRYAWKDRSLKRVLSSSAAQGKNIYI